MMRAWTDTIVEKALELRAGGLTYGEAARAIGRKPRALECAIIRYKARQSMHPYLKDLDGPPIGIDDDMIGYRKNAIQGSARLLAEIERVFGRAA